MRYLFFTFFLLITTSLCFSATINVPADQPTIQAGIDAAVNGDSIIVAPGTYTENLDYSGKNIVVSSSSGAESTTLIPSDLGTEVIKIISGEDNSTVFKGFTVTGVTYDRGIAINNGAQPLICDNIFHHCAVSNAVIRVYVTAEGTFRNNLFYENGGESCIATYQGTIYVYNNTFDNNNRGFHSVDNQSYARNNIVTNSNDYGIAGDFILDYNNVWNNNPNFGAGEIQGANGISLDAQYVDAATFNYTLQPTSPCIDTGDPDPQYNDPDGTRNDMGAYPLERMPKMLNVPADYPTIQSGIDAAIDGDTVLVAEGQYFERINFLGKSIIVASEYLLDPDSNHILNTIIDGTDVPPIADTVSLIRFVNNEDLLSVVNGFSISNSTTGIFAWNSEASIYNCKFIECGDAFLSNSNNIISDCSFDQNGIAVRLQGGIPIVRNCQFTDNDKSLNLFFGSGVSTDSCKFINSDINIGNGAKEKNVGNGQCQITNSSLLNSSISIYGGYRVTLINDTVVSSNIGIAFNMASYDYLSTFNNSIIVDCDLTILGSGASFDSCYFKGNTYISGTDAVGIRFDNSTVVSDSLACHNGFYSFNNCNIGSISHRFIFSLFSHPLVLSGMSFNCCNIFGVDSLNWFEEYYETEIDTSFVYFEDPLFCDTLTGDFSIYDVSICAPNNNACGELIGAYGVGCVVEPPVFDPIPDTSVTEMNLLEVDVSATCADGASPILSAASLPDDAVFTDYEDGTGLFSWQTGNFDAGEYDVSLLAHHPDYPLLYDSQAFHITVVDTNLMPIFVMIPPSQENEVYEGDTLINTFIALDPDSTIPHMILDSAYVPDSLSFLLDHITFTDSGNGVGVLEFYPDYTMAELPVYTPGVYYLRWKVVDADDDQLFDYSQPYTYIVLGSDHQVLSIAIDGQSPAMNVIAHAPIIEWSYSDPLDLKAQTQVEIAVGSDDDWTYAELWNPAPETTSDTMWIYAGSTLEDGMTYYLRLRVHNGVAWSQWYEMSFRMNTPPTIPSMLAPIDSAIVASTQPYLWVLNALDAEGDDLFYDYLCYVDCVVYGGTNIVQTPDSTAWQVDPALIENWSYPWLARAYDGYEYSDWTAGEIFFVNETEEFPYPFELTYPPDTGWSQVYDFPTEFTWVEPFEPDPLDSVHYKLLLSTDENFTFVSTHDSLWDNSHSIMLDYGTHYWWKVQAIDTKGNMTESDNTADFLTWVLGDANADNGANIGDGVYLVSFIFGGGAAPDPTRIGDINGDGCTNIGDVVYMVNYIFRGGEPPQVGSDDCGGK